MKPTTKKQQAKHNLRKVLSDSWNYHDSEIDRLTKLLDSIPNEIEEHAIRRDNCQKGINQLNKEL